jgi:Helix-turn-helix
MKPEIPLRADFKTALKFVRIHHLHRTQGQLAMAIGLTGPAVSNWERGLRIPSKVAMAKMEGLLRQNGFSFAGIQSLYALWEIAIQNSGTRMSWRECLEVAGDLPFDEGFSKDEVSRKECRVYEEAED